MFRKPVKSVMPKNQATLDQLFGGVVPAYLWYDFREGVVEGTLPLEDEQPLCDLFFPGKQVGEVTNAQMDLCLSRIFSDGKHRLPTLRIHNGAIAPLSITVNGKEHLLVAAGDSEDDRTASAIFAEDT